MREKLTLMRENDLKIQNEFAQLEEDASQFLTGYRQYQQQCSLSPTRSKINTRRAAPSAAGSEETPTDASEQPLTAEQLAAQQQKQAEYDKLVERHQQLIKATTAKVNLANDSHDIVERYFKKLESDLNKFKMELEADYSGITETLEKRTYLSQWMSDGITGCSFAGFASEGFNEYDNAAGENSKPLKSNAEMHIRLSTQTISIPRCWTWNRSLIRSTTSPCPVR